jgi:hypothetical protein
MTGRAWVAAVALMALSGCSTIRDLWSGGPRELPRVHEGAVTLACDQSRTLIVRMDAGKSAWIIQPEREFRLDAASGESRYSNGRATLTVSGGEMSFEESGSPALTHCRNPQS